MIHLVSTVLMRNNTMNGEPMGDILRRSVCGLTLGRWQESWPLPKPPEGTPWCGNCVRTKRYKDWKGRA